jgi:hypothetical protein
LNWLGKLDPWRVQLVLHVLILGCCAVLIALRPRPSIPLVLPRAGKKRPMPVPLPVPPVPPVWQRSVAGIVVALVWLGVAAFLVARGNDPIGRRPDSWSDANVVVSGRNYAREGLLKHWGAAQHQVITEQNPEDPYFRYTQYPVASNLINGLWQCAGITSDRAYRSIPAACSLAGLLVWFALYRRAAGLGVATVAFCAMAFSFSFLAYADNLHFHAYAMFTSAVTAWGYLQALASARRWRWVWLALLAVAMFLTAWFTWEYHLWMVLFIGAHTLLCQPALRRRYIPLLLLPLVVALVLQNVQRRLAFADVRLADAHEPRSGFLDDMYRRTVAFKEAVDTPPGLTLPGYPVFLAGRYAKFYGLPALGALALTVCLLVRERRALWRVREWSAENRLLVVLLVAGAGWWLVMLQHTAVHPHTMRQGLSGYALLVALAGVHCWRTARSREAHRVARGAAVLLGLTLLVPQLDGLWSAWLIHHPDWQDPPLPRYYDSVRERGDAGSPEVARMGALAELVPPGGVILTNQGRLPPMRLWSQRPVYAGGLTEYRPNAADEGRLMVELSFNHLRELYQGALPPLYYVDAQGCRYAQARGAQGALAIVHADPLLRLFLTGQGRNDPAQEQRGAQYLVQAATTGRCRESFCPIVGQSDYLLVFDLRPVVPLLEKMWSHQGAPSLRQYGPPR